MSFEGSRRETQSLDVLESDIGGGSGSGVFNFRFTRATLLLFTPLAGLVHFAAHVLDGRSDDTAVPSTKEKHFEIISDPYCIPEWLVPFSVWILASLPSGEFPARFVTGLLHLPARSMQTAWLTREAGERQSHFSRVLDILFFRSPKEKVVKLGHKECLGVGHVFPRRNNRDEIRINFFLLSSYF